MAPARQHKTTWKEFLRRHWEVLAAADFFTVEVWTETGLTSYLVLVVMELATRRIEIAGVTAQASSQWVEQVAQSER